MGERDLSNRAGARWAMLPADRQNLSHRRPVGLTRSVQCVYPWGLSWRLTPIFGAVADMRYDLLMLLCGVMAMGAGCRTLLIEPTDRDVYDLITSRQRHALGIQADADIGEETGEAASTSRMYSMNPRPLPPEVPAPFRKPLPQPDAHRADADEPIEDVAPPTTDDLIPESLFTDEQMKEVRRFSLYDALVYAMRHARDLQNAREELYLEGLDLSLERHLWTPQFVAEMQANYDDFESDAETDRAVSAVSEVAVSQRLRFGGEIVARVIHSLMRDVGEHVANSETGDVILSADIPLFRGAGPSAYESRYAAERELIYAVRRYERFRRSFLVAVAADFFNLQERKASITNTHQSYMNRRLDWDKADFIHRMGRSRTIAEAPRARANFRNAEARLVSAKEAYATALDRFKIRIGMAVGELLDVMNQDQDEGAKRVDRLLPDVDEPQAVELATRYRLDLINSADQVDDARRGVAIAKNRILPDLDLTASVAYASPADQLRAANFSEDRALWQAGVQLRMDDRKTERNAYRRSLVSLRRAQRDHEEFVDSVRADVRRALRRVAQQDNLRRIQESNVAENEIRYEGARAQYDLGRSTNQDVVDAQNDLLEAQNNLAAAVADYRIAILQFRRDTGTLRVTDEGRWETPEDSDNAGGGDVDPDAGP